MRQHDLSHEGFASSIGNTRSAVSNWLVRTSRPNLDTAYLIDKQTGGEVPIEAWLHRQTKNRLRLIEEKKTHE